MSRVCAVHNEYCPDGACRWCDPPLANMEALRAAFHDVGLTPVAPPRARSGLVELMDLRIREAEQRMIDALMYGGDA